ncbi:MAG: DUF1761 domain-containing protein [Candidatus Aenigmarchaeota archaeon]|nr:DUF1761 domain-containing protein [Candidatus Aenigmarchaeota archaeon]
MADVNLVAVVVAAVLNIVIGMLWYSPLLFGRKWLSAMGLKKGEMKKEGMAKVHVLMFIAALIMSYVLATFIDFTAATTAMQGVATGFWVWIGFVATTLLPVYIFENRPKQLYGIYAAYQLVFLLVAGAMLAVWV